MWGDSGRVSTVTPFVRKLAPNFYALALPVEDGPPIELCVRARPLPTAEPLDVQVAGDRDAGRDGDVVAAHAVRIPEVQCGSTEVALVCTDLVGLHRVVHRVLARGLRGRDQHDPDSDRHHESEDSLHHAPTEARDEPVHFTLHGVCRMNLMRLMPGTQSDRPTSNSETTANGFRDCSL